MPRPEQSEKERPVFLTVICIISYVLSGIGITGNIFYIIFSDYIKSFYNSYWQFYSALAEDHNHLTPSYSNFMEETMKYTQQYFESIREIASLSLLLTIVSLFGVILMWNLKRSGFYIYSIANLLMLTIPFIFTETNYITLVSVLFSGLFAGGFIIMYGINLKYME